MPCCDVCLHAKTADENAILTAEEEDILALYKYIQSRPPLISVPLLPVIDDGCIVEHDIKMEEVKVDLKKNQGLGNRRGDRLKRCRHALECWRTETWERDFGACVWGPDVLMPDKVLRKLALHTRIRTLEDIKTEIPDWDFCEEYGADVLDALQVEDRTWSQENNQSIQDRATLRAAESATKRLQREEDKRAVRSTKSTRRRLEQDVQNVHAGGSGSNTATSSSHIVLHTVYPHNHLAYPVPQYPPVAPPTADHSGSPPGMYWSYTYRGYLPIDNKPHV